VWWYYYWRAVRTDSCALYVRVSSNCPVSVDSEGLCARVRFNCSVCVDSGVFSVSVSLTVRYVLTAGHSCPRNFNSQPVHLMKVKYSVFGCKISSNLLEYISIFITFFSVDLFVSGYDMFFCTFLAVELCVGVLVFSII
jgi:hypothetical protein